MVHSNFHDQFVLLFIDEEPYVYQQPTSNGKWSTLGLGWWTYATIIDLLKSAAALAGRVRSPPLLYNYGPRKQNSPVAASSAPLLKDLSCEGTVSKARANHPNGAEDDESGKSLAQAKFPSASSAYQFQLLIYSIPGGCFNFSRR